MKEERFQKSSSMVSHMVTRVKVAHPMKVDSYSELVDFVSLLSSYNNKYILFFRGQSQEYRMNGPYPSVYPKFFRDYFNKKHNFNQLKDRLVTKTELLRQKSHDRQPQFPESLLLYQNTHIAWALLQHYEICNTPLVDVTQSIHVAASFALLKKPKSSDSKGIIYVFALPWPSKDYYRNIQEDIFLIRLAGITPSDAKRPYRQEAFTVSSADFTFENKEEFEKYDLANRLVCKFEINNSPEFWGETIHPLPESFLAPEDDEFCLFMKEALHEN